MKKSEFELLFDISKYYTKEIAKKVLKKIKQLKDKSMLLSGDDSGLKNVWEEYCVQIQGEESYYIDIYEDIVAASVKEIYTKYPVPVKQAINYMGSIDQSEETEDSYNNDFFGIQETLKEVNYLAGNFENKRINNYLNNDSDW
ncbi:MAG: hypothetical protein U0V54_06040 [Saprospiraceae bacterium]